MKFTYTLVLAAFLLVSCSCPKTAEVDIIRTEDKTAYSLQVKGAETAGITPDSVTLVSKFYQNVEDVRGAGEFVQNVATGEFGNDSYGWQQVVAGIPRSSHAAKSRLKTPVYARFSQKDSTGGQRIMLEQDKNRLVAAKDLIGEVFQVTDTRWIKQKNNIRLTLFIKPVQAQ